MLVLTVNSRLAIILDKPAILHRVLKDALRREVLSLTLWVYKDPLVALERTPLHCCPTRITILLIIVSAVR